MNIPHNIEAERALLHQLIFEAIESIHREGRNPDMISVSEWLASAEDIIASTTEKLEKIASSKTLSPTTTLSTRCHASVTSLHLRPDYDIQMGTRTAILPRLEKQEGCHRPPEIRHRPLPRTETADQQGSAEPKSLLPLPGEADTGISGGAVKV